jgi:hypothetical protein
MIDETSNHWFVPAFLAALAFLFGGVLAGCAVPPRRWFMFSCLGLRFGRLLLGALFRRFWIVHESAQNAVVDFGASGSPSHHAELDLIIVRWSVGDGQESKIRVQDLRAMRNE